MKSKLPHLPEAELEVMQAVWQLIPPVATPQIKQKLEQNRPWHSSALQTLLNRLIDRGFLNSEKHGKCRYYQPLVSESDYLAMENKRFLNRLHGNSITHFVSTLYDQQDLDEADLAELAAFLEAKKQQLKK